MISKPVTLYLSYGFPVRVPVSQFDTMWQFVFTIIKDSVTWTIPTGATAVLNGLKPDGNVFAFAGTISGNTVTVNCDVQMTAVAGDTICELSILADGKTVGTANFTLAVEAAPKSPDDVSSDSTLPAYAELLEMFSGDIEDEVDSWLNAHSSQIGGLTNEAKQALLTLLAHVAYTDDQGQTYLDALETALYPPVDLVSISAVFTQGSAVIYDTDDLDDLRQYLVVTAHYTDSTTGVVTTYTLSGVLAAGTSTITVSYGGKTTTFNVVVTHEQTYVTNGLIHWWDGIDNTRSGHSASAINWHDLVGNVDLTKASGTWIDNALSINNGTSVAVYAAELDNPSAATIEVCFKSTGSASTVIATFNPASGTGSRDARRFVLFTDNTVNGIGNTSNSYQNTESAIADIRSMSVDYTDLSINHLYINSTETTKGTSSHSFRYQGNNQMEVGGTSSSYYFSGEIYCIRIYNRSLTAAEVAQNYAVDVQRFGLE